MDSLCADVKCILDKHIPTNPPNSTLRQRIFRTTLSKEVVAEIEKKKRLLKYRKSSKYHWNKYKEQRNKVVKLVREEKNLYAKKQFKPHDKAKIIQEKIERLKNHFNQKIYNDKTRLAVENFSGRALANKMALFYKARAEDLVTDQEISSAGPPNHPLRSDDTIEPMEEIIFPKIDLISDYIPKSKFTNTHGPAQISSKLLSTFWADIRPHLNKILENKVPT